MAWILVAVTFVLCVLTSVFGLELLIHRLHSRHRHEWVKEGYPLGPFYKSYEAPFLRGFLSVVAYKNTALVTNDLKAERLLTVTC